MSRPALLALGLLLFAGACHRETEAERQGKRAADIAAVRAAQNVNPPPVAVVPEPVDFAELNAPGNAVALPADVTRPHSGDGCRFLAAGAPADRASFVAAGKVALMRARGATELFAADSGSDRLNDALFAKYASTAHQVTMTRGNPASDAPAGTSAWAGTMSVRDEYDRVVYFSAGEIRCKD